MMTKEFKKWFEGSTVVDEQGNPLKVYHGSPRKFKNFNFHTSSMIFFATNRKVAEYFAEGNEVKECYLNIKRPFEFDAKGCLWDNLPQDLEDEEWYDGLCIEDLIGEHVLGKGYDGAYIKDIIETDSHDWDMKYLTDDYVVFDPSQIWIIGEEMEEKRFTENKDARIDKLNLTDEQKVQVKDLFRKHPELEGKIDWNRKDLTFDDFKPLFEIKSKSSKKKASKKGGALDSLEKGVDYEIVKQEGAFTLYKVNTYEAMCIIASNAVEPQLMSFIPTWACRNENEWYQNKFRDPDTGVALCEGAHWCVAMTKTKAHWDDYSDKEFYVFTNSDTFDRDSWGKVCIFSKYPMVEPELSDLEYWDADDNWHAYSELEEDAPHVLEFIDGVDFSSRIPLETPLADALEERLHVDSLEENSMVTIREKNGVLLAYEYSIEEEEMSGGVLENLDFDLNVPPSLYKANREKVTEIFRKYVTLTGYMSQASISENYLYFTVYKGDPVVAILDTLGECFNELTELKEVVFDVAPTDLKERLMAFSKNVGDRYSDKSLNGVWEETDYAVFTCDYGTEKVSRGGVDEVAVLRVHPKEAEKEAVDWVSRVVDADKRRIGYDGKYIKYYMDGDDTVLELHGENSVLDSWSYMIFLNRIFGRYQERD